MATNDKAVPELLKTIPADSQTLSLPSLGPNDLAHKVQRNLEDYGLRITAGKTLAYLVRWIYFRQVYRIYGIKLDSCTAPEPSLNFDFSFKLVMPQDSHLIAQIENTAEWLRGTVKNRIAAGQLCLVALVGEKVAGFNLINLELASLILVHRKKKLRPGCAWSEHIAVLKGFRKSGLGAHLRYRIFEVLKSRGIRKLYGGTLRSNTASLKLSRAVGFREICDIHYSKFLSFRNWQFRRLRD
jgi:GNAT superfamily N-acetyltransferase